MAAMTFVELGGKGVFTQDGRSVGQITDVVFDTTSWAMQNVIVKLDRALFEELQLPKPFLGSHTIRLPTKSISGVSDTVILREGFDQIIPLLKRSADKS